MKNKVNVVKKIAFLMITVALAVALMACQGAVGKPGADGQDGKDGTTGPQGISGPQGPPGTTDNTEPMLRPGKMLPTVYLALGGTGKKTSFTHALKPYFQDDKSLTLDYGAMSSAPAIATAKVTSGTDSLVIEALEAGEATATISVYDNVTGPTKELLSIMVVATNARPSAAPAILPADMLKLEKKAQITKVVTVRTISWAVSAGASPGVDDVVEFKTGLKPAVGTTALGKLTKVEVTAIEGSKPNTVDVSIKGIKVGKEPVRIEAHDKFGAIAAHSLDFEATVNAVPKRDSYLPDITLFRSADKGPPVKDSTYTYTVSDHFDVENDTTCTVETNPKQPLPGKAKAADLASVDTTVSDGKDPGAGADGSVLSIIIDASEKDAAEIGEFSLTITCADDEDSASDMAVVKVRK